MHMKKYFCKVLARINFLSEIYYTRKLLITLSVRKLYIHSIKHIIIKPVHSCIPLYVKNLKL